MRTHAILTALVISALALTALPAVAAPDRAAVTQLFADADRECKRDHGALWGVSLCGPIFVVDYTDQKVLANRADAGGVLKRDGALWGGVLPDSVIIANTPTDWSGTHWTQIVVPVLDEAEHRQVMIAHELFHRIQPGLGLTRPETSNKHLDTLEGRYFMQLEWRALARALQAKTKVEQRAALADAIGFRRWRYRLFPGAAADEAALEVQEGVPEYTGVRLGLPTHKAQIAYAVRDTSAFVDAPSFVRSFAYAIGPAYGLMLDEADPAWRHKLNSGRRLDELLADALKLDPTAGDAVAVRAKLYDDGTLRAHEEQRDRERQARLAAFKARLVDGAVLVLPVKHGNYQFNPQTLVPLEGYGTIYPTMRLTDDWGALEIDHGGCLIRNAEKQATVSAEGVDKAGLSGDGWKLTLNTGWTVKPGARPGDLAVARDEAVGGK